MPEVTGSSPVPPTTSLLTRFHSLALSTQPTQLDSPAKVSYFCCYSRLTAEDRSSIAENWMRPMRKSTQDKLRIIKMAGGPITVACRQEEDLWLCTALQFDIVGTGPTKEAAFEELKELVNAYLTHLLQAKGKISVFNPSDRAEWETPLKENYDVLVVLAEPAATVSSARVLSLDEVRPVRRRVREFELTPVAAG